MKTSVERFHGLGFCDEQGHFLLASFLLISSSSVSEHRVFFFVFFFNYFTSCPIGQYCLSQLPFWGWSLHVDVPAFSVSSSLFTDWTYCGCSLALSHPSCPSAWHVPSAAPAGDVLSKLLACTYVFLFVLPHAVYCIYPNCVCVCVSFLLSLTKPPDPPVSIATGPPVVIVTITPTLLLLWRAKVCLSFP